MPRCRFLQPLACTVAILTASAVTRAAVTEPDGAVVPNLAIDATIGETSLATFFTNQGESIDALQDASPDPGVFSPLCDFSAELIFSQSQGKAGVAWYNVPADPTSTPQAVYQLLPPSNTIPANSVATSADIRNHPSYAGGLIGFVLTDNGGPMGPDGTSRIYYSEPQRNVYCSGCLTPGYWIMTLAYKSTLPRYPNTYYLAFEDWYTTSATSRGQTDGDFNDKVFRISGIQCQGGGVPCDTGQLGVCRPGLTECTIGTTVVCRAQVPASAERCDNVDNDCDGVVDDGNDLCDTGKVCDRGNCVAACSPTEFPCPSELACWDGYCVERACAGITCDPGLVCRGGQCVDACSGVACPFGQLCETGLCVDPCANVTCGTGTVCAGGACVASCGCAGCPAGKVCRSDGSCVDSGCETRTCATGEVCVAGTCVDACRDAVCPGQAACSLGQCGAPGPGSGAGGGTNLVVRGTGGNLATPSPTGSSGAGCGCRIPSRAGNPTGLAGVVLGALLLARKRRRMSRDQSVFPKSSGGVPPAGTPP